MNQQQDDESRKVRAIEDNVREWILDWANSSWETEKFLDGYIPSLTDLVHKITNTYAASREGVSEPTERMCDAARGFILGLDMGIRTWHKMIVHIDRGGYECTVRMRDMAEKDPDGHITKWDIADTIYQLMQRHCEATTPATQSPGYLKSSIPDYVCEAMGIENKPWTPEDVAKLFATPSADMQAEVVERFVRYYETDVGDDREALDAIIRDAKAALATPQPAAMQGVSEDEAVELMAKAYDASPECRTQVGWEAMRAAYRALKQAVATTSQWQDADVRALVEAAREVAVRGFTGQHSKPLTLVPDDAFNKLRKRLKPFNGSEG